MKTDNESSLSGKSVIQTEDKPKLSHPVEKANLENAEPSDRNRFWNQLGQGLDWLGRLGHLAIIIGVITFIFTEDSRRNAAVFSAWQTINSAEGKSGSGGRIQALEFLNSRPLRFPLISPTQLNHLNKSNDKKSDELEWYWYSKSKKCQKQQDFFVYKLWFRWDQEDLYGLSAPRAYLRKVNLCGAKLKNANLQEAKLWEANLQNAHLKDTNLEDADLRGANLKNTDLKDTNLSGAIYSDSESKFRWCSNDDCSTIFPDEFDPKQAGMILIRTDEDFNHSIKSRQK